MNFDQLAQDTIYLRRGDSRTGPFKAVFEGTKVIVLDLPSTPGLDPREGDVVERELKSGRTETYTVLRADFHNSPFPQIPSNWELDTRKAGDLSQQPSSRSNVHIENAGSVQIGDHNVQNIVNSLTSLASAIDQADGSESEKSEAKSKFMAFLRHPLVVKMLGTAAASVSRAFGA